MTTPITGADVGSAADTTAGAGQLPVAELGTALDSAQASLAEFSFANLPQVVIAWLLGIEGLGDVGINMPNPPTLPYVLVSQVPGGTDNRVTAKGLVDLDIFTGDPGTVITFARRVHARMLALRNQVVTVGDWPVPIGEISTLRLPGYSQYSDDPLLMHRVIASYEIRSDFDAQPL